LGYQGILESNTIQGEETRMMNTLVNMTNYRRYRPILVIFDEGKFFSVKTSLSYLHRPVNMKDSNYIGLWETRMQLLSP
jgi:hypothetical protein